MKDVVGVVVEVHEQGVPEIYLRVFWDVEEEKILDVARELDQDYTMEGVVVVGLDDGSFLVFVDSFHRFSILTFPAGEVK